MRQLAFFLGQIGLPVLAYLKGGFLMLKTEIAEYTFTVEEGEFDPFIMCEPHTGQSSLLGSDGFLTIQLFPGTSVGQAQDIARYLIDNVSGIGVTTF